MDRSNAPFQPQDPSHVASVVQNMTNHAGKGGKRGIRRKVYDVGDGTKRTVASWSVPDWNYKQAGLPTYARGLFTHSNNGKQEIACRGYDKFFNVNEIRATEWANVERNTRGPYELSVKENGCIIFIGALDDSSLLITSKHSTGPREGGEANHSLAGAQWLDKQLATLGKTRADLAKRLRTMNATAVAELCDDEFEEHVLRYDPEIAGLYLHGINLNLPEFATYPGDLVNDFADEWGFRRVMYVMEDDITKVRSFLETVAETGNYDGRDTEGFVIRCQARDKPGEPYHDWFFKYKFEEPYLMYRQWREVTKSIISGKAPRFKKHKAITEEYILYARRQLARDPSIGREFNKNHGIIAMRDGFLKEKGVKGSDIIRTEEAEGDFAASNTIQNVVLVPIATIGCGKTTIALALTKLFGWGHEQNDNIEGKGRRPQRFATAVTTSLALHPVVIADRNNHQFREREQIIHDVQTVVPNVKIVALHFVHDRRNFEDIRATTRDRVLSRGDNHQTIQAGSKGEEEIIGIMEGFLNRFEPINTEKSPDDGFDFVIDLDVNASSRENLQTIIEQLQTEYPKLLRTPTDQEMDDAIAWALNDYKPQIKHDLGGGSNRKEKKALQKPNAPTAVNSPKPAKKPEVEFFCIRLNTARVNSILDAVFSGEDAETSRFYKQLKAARRIQPEFHVTLMHRASVSQRPDYWNMLVDLWQQKQGANGEHNGNASAQPSETLDLPLGAARVQLERVVWDGRLMAIVCRLPDTANTPSFQTVNDFAHITVGTGANSIKPKESNDMLKAWNEGVGKNTHDLKVKGNVVLDGIVKGVLRR